MASNSTEPVGEAVFGIAALEPSSVTLNGKHCTLTRLSLEYSPALYQNVAGVDNASLWTYLPRGPYLDENSFTEHVNFLCQDRPFFTFAIWSSSTLHISNQGAQFEAACSPETPIGLIAYLNIVPEHRSIEIGHILFPKTLQRTTAATEAVYLLIKHCFEDLHYLRVEWKANNHNEPSKRAALRFGFLFEGVFKKHMVVKGKHRDTAWFSITDDEWHAPHGVKSAFEAWLKESNFEEGKQRKRLEDFRSSTTRTESDHKVSGLY
ncbi:GNAT family acetyltransferase [Phlyctema vagabunda]|uniref:GNAT family acetyltransferase n=1 Tax=Phlyctema vagabunda TaxID=108571 RepID=A0ABR4P6M8_9HELO